MADAGDQAFEHQEETMQRSLAARQTASAARPSATRCIECDEPIPVQRRELLPGVQHCVDCAAIAERRR